jgi:eukaryotic-like serine/threonine-protein kinase
MASANAGHVHPMMLTGGDGLQNMPEMDDIVAGMYRIEHVLGRGGMGLVVAAQHTTLCQRVAMKLLLPEAMSIDGASEWFLREARSAAAIQSEHVARLLDVGELENGTPYMVMEHLNGIHLAKHLRASGPLPVDEAVDYVLQACEAIAEAHMLGVIHRDLKPANLFLTARADGSPLVKVLDFGLSKPIRPDAPNGLEASLTATNTLIGSPHYMSPEQVRCLKTIDARTDIWSLGVILYELLTGQLPFDNGSVAAVVICIATEPPLPVEARRPDLPAGLARVIGRCLEKNTSRRVQSVSEFAQALAPFGSPRSQVSVERVTRMLASSPAHGPEPLMPTAAPLPAPARKSRGDATTAMASTLADEGKPPSREITRGPSRMPKRWTSLVALGAAAALVAATAAALTLVPLADAQPAGAAGLEAATPATLHGAPAPPRGAPAATSSAATTPGAGATGQADNSSRVARQALSTMASASARVK